MLAIYMCSSIALLLVFFWGEFFLGRAYHLSINYIVIEGEQASVL